MQNKGDNLLEDYKKFTKQPVNLLDDYKSFMQADKKESPVAVKGVPARPASPGGSSFFQAESTSAPLVEIDRTPKTDTKKPIESGGQPGKIPTLTDYLFEKTTDIGEYKKFKDSLNDEGQKALDIAENAYKEILDLPQVPLQIAEGKLKEINKSKSVLEGMVEAGKLPLEFGMFFINSLSDLITATEIPGTDIPVLNPFSTPEQRKAAQERIAQNPVFTTLGAMGALRGIQGKLPLKKEEVKTGKETETAKQATTQTEQPQPVKKSTVSEQKPVQKESAAQSKFEGNRETFKKMVESENPTREAVKYGLENKQYSEQIKKLGDEAEKEFRSLKDELESTTDLARIEEIIDQMQKMSTEVQMYREAHEAATNTGSIAQGFKSGVFDEELKGAGLRPEDFKAEKQPKKIQNKESLKKAVKEQFNIPEDQADAVSALTEARAEAAISQGIVKSKEEYYSKFDIRKGTQKTAQKLAQKQAQFQKKEKQPWEMTKKEWNDIKDSLRADTSGEFNSNQLGGMGRATSEKGFKSRTDKVKAIRDHIYYGIKSIKDLPTDAQDFAKEMGFRVSHYAVINKAVNENKPIPSNVLNEYPELKNKFYDKNFELYKKQTSNMQTDYINIGDIKFYKVEQIEGKKLPKGRTYNAYTNGINIFIKDGLNKKQFNDALSHEIDHINNKYYPSDKEEYPSLFQSKAMFQDAQEAGVPPFYSKLSRVVDEKMSNAMPVDQLRAMLKKNGVKDEEIEFSLQPFIEGKGKVSKADVQSWLEENSVQVQEVVKEDKSYKAILPEGWTISEFPDGANVYNEKGEHVGEGNSPENALADAGIRYEPGTTTKFAEYQVPGGENYRELLLTLPEKQFKYTDKWDYYKSRGYTEEQFNKLSDVEKNNLFVDWTDIFDEQNKNMPQNFRSTHFDEPNILAHVRFNERTDADGKKVLFIEEVQSDWHQKGRKQGYRQNLGNINISRLNFGIYLTNDRGIILRGPFETMELAEEAQRKLSDLDKVPNAPFKSTWQDLAMKRMLRWAAENGFDRVAWTTGEQQAERYDLSKQVSTVEYFPEQNRLKAYPHSTNNPIIENNVTREKLSGYIGKDAAEKILKQPIEKGTDGNRQILSGQDLKVGGEGMKAFYDKMLVNTANKLGKKYGAQVEETTIQSGDNIAVIFNAAGKEVWAGNANKIPKLDPGDRVEYPNKNNQPSLPITGQMRFALINEGLPLFQDKYKGATEFLADGRVIVHAFESADVSTAVHELAHVWRKELPETDNKIVLDDYNKQFKGTKKAIDVDVEEHFAKSFEQYLQDGKAPNSKLKQVFENFKKWLTDIYAGISGSKIKVSNELKDVFDRMLTVEQKTKGEERSFPKTLESKEIEGGIDRVYDVFTDEEALKLANDRISKNEDSAFQYAKNDTEGLSKEKVTTGILMLQRMKNEIAKEKDIDKKTVLAQKSIELASTLSRQLTEAGQSVQAASIVGRLSPEGILLQAQKRINEYNKNVKKKIELKPEDVAEITNLSESLSGEIEFSGEIGRNIEVINKLKSGDTLSNKDLKDISSFVNKLNKKYKPSLKKENDALVDLLDRKENEAKERLKKRGYNLNIGVDPRDISDFAIIGAAKLVKTGIKFAEWSKEMIADFGKDIEPHLEKIFGKSKVLFAGEKKKIRNANKLSNQLNKLVRNMESSTKITEADLATIKTLIDNVKDFSDEAKEEAHYELTKFLQDLEKPTIGRQLATAQTIAQLLNPKTNIRNIFGNELFYRIERLNKYVAAPIDWVASKLTGKNRTITFKTEGQSGYWEGLMKGVRAGWRGYNIEGLETQYSLTGLTFKSKINPLHWMEKAMGATLRGFDFAAYTRGYNNFIGEQAALHIMNNKLKFETKAERQKFVEDFAKNIDFEIAEMASEYGKYLTFQDENIFSNSAVQIKRILNLNRKFGLGDFILKYPKTPANLIARGLEYSPAGIARSISILTKPFDNPDVKNREIIQSTSRAITGTLGFTGLGTFLYSMGIITGEEEKDRDVRQFKSEQTGERNYQINVSAIKRWVYSGFKKDKLKKQNGDLLVSYDWAQPIALSLSLGANMAKNISERRDYLEGSTDVALESLNSALITVAEQPLLKGLRDFFGSNYDDGFVKRFSRVFSGVPASFTPTFLSQIRQYMDNERRISYDPNVLQQTINKVIYKLPMVNRTLPKAFKTLGGKAFKNGKQVKGTEVMQADKFEGEVAEMYKDGTNTLFNVFFNPSFISKYSIDPEIQMILEPYINENRKYQFPKVAPYTIRASKRTLDGYGLKTEHEYESFRLNAEDISAFQARMSVTITELFKDIDKEHIKNIPFERQEEMLANRVRDSYEKTKEWFFKNKAKNYLIGAKQ